jgi:hypothetical protein
MEKNHVFLRKASRKKVKPGFTQSVLVTEAQAVEVSVSIAS